MQPQTRSFLAIAAVLLVVIATLTIPRLRSEHSVEASGRAAAPSAGSDGPTPALKVSTALVTPRPLAEHLSTTGTLRANERVDLVSEIAGKVREIYFDEGSAVEAGKVLLKIDDAELLAQKERSRYRLELASNREAQQKRLFGEGIISQEEYESELAQKNVLEAEDRLINSQLAKTEIKAPFAGIIGLRAVSVGSFLSPQTRIATLQDIDPIKLDFAVPEKYAGRVKVGAQVQFSIKGQDDHFEGEIYAVEPLVDPETRSLTVRARSANPGRRLTPGAFADVELAVKEIPRALTVPAIAVIPDLAGKKVFVIEDGKAAVRTITTGLRTETEVEVVSGLAEGDRVITSGLQIVRPGQPVEAE
ncbi:MAG: efflux RND transporter periplasmic adaptor subunit [Thermoanaerobaculia bacterium]